MKAVQFKFGGDHDVVNLPKPKPVSGEIVVQVKYSALDTAHPACLNKELSGYFLHSLKAPLYLGYHYSGVVETVGADVTDLATGTGVFGFLQYEPSQIQGALAEYITVKRQDCAVKPASVAYELAAASATESVTALQAMRDLGGLVGKGQFVLINGSAGGVGSAAVQIAKRLGAHVTAVCSTKDVERVKEWGADNVIDRTKEPNFLKTLLKQKETKFDVILDAPNMLSSCATGLLQPKGGAIVNTVPTLTMVIGKIKTMLSCKKTVTSVHCRAKEADLKLVCQWLEEGDLEIPIDSIFKINNMQAAMNKQVMTGKKGRIVIQVENGW